MGMRNLRFMLMSPAILASVHSRIASAFEISHSRNAPTAMSRSSNAGVVYSSEHGRMCPDCGKPVAQCHCKTQKSKKGRPETDGVVRVRPEKSGRGGKTVTAIYGVPGTEDELKTLAKKLKKRAGTGGSVKDWAIIIQGDRVDDAISWLKAEGYRVKRSGG